LFGVFHDLLKFSFGSPWFLEFGGNFRHRFEESAGTCFTSMDLASGFGEINGSNKSTLPPTTAEKHA
jgi:hypothetical protein